jgi:hypothetical protein
MSSSFYGGTYSSYYKYYSYYSSDNSKPKLTKGA